MEGHHGISPKSGIDSEKVKFELVFQRQTIEAPFILRHDMLVKRKLLLTHADLYDSVPRPMIISFSSSDNTKT